MKLANIFLRFAVMITLLIANGSKCYAMGDNDTPYRPFVEDGKSWVVTFSYAHGWLAPYRVECYYIDGDTLAGSQPCKKLMLRTNDLENKSVTTSLDRLIYEVDKKVYCYPTIDGTIQDRPVLLYDFSANPGDTLSLGGIYDAEVSVTRCFQILDTPQLNWHGDSFNGQQATYYDPELTTNNVFETPSSALFCWYESIGSGYDPFTKFLYNCVGVKSLRDCRVGDRVIYTNWIEGRLFPDFTGDGLVDITDVNQVLNNMLGRSINALSDATGDGRVDIADVNAVINAMLGQQ